MNTSELCTTFMNKEHNWAQLPIPSFKVMYYPLFTAQTKWLRCYILSTGVHTLTQSTTHDIEL